MPWQKHIAENPVMRAARKNSCAAPGAKPVPAGHSAETVIWQNAAATEATKHAPPAHSGKTVRRCKDVISSPNTEK